MIEGGYRERMDADARGDKATKYVVKIALNSIYGRLGLKEEREIAVFTETVAPGDDVSFLPLPRGSYKLPAGGFLSFKRVASSPKANYLFAAAITCNARGRLYDALAKTNPLYCDTDSCFVPAGSPFPLPQGTWLGEWKPEGTGRLVTTGAKDYTFGDKVKLKGGTGRIQWTMKRALAGKPAKMVTKTRRSTYDKRDVLPSGKTLPLYLQDW
jgi:hypothetical protein